MTSRASLERLKAMIHYIVETAPPRSIGKVKLNKVLWFADKDYYLRTGKTISGDKYLRFPQGPVSDNLPHALDELATERKIYIRKERVFSYEKYCYISLIEPDTSMFSGDEVAAIQRALDFVSPLTAQQISAISHDRIWEIFQHNEEIPMCAVLAADTQIPAQEDIEWAKKQEWA